MTTNEIYSDHITIESANDNKETRKNSIYDSHAFDKPTKRRGHTILAFAKFLYDSKKKTVLGRDALNWGKSN